ncbi:LamB/YcsF family protein [Cohnella mopanensis]|uniref:LamB/YcsF family protein n=1 Tax=Cohnella mopanensis TaxID=2911966 RepID=UPI001EF8D5C1|nr:5-oxoprolinase subunit PxpA [Cohnella mopanensis]
MAAIDLNADMGEGYGAYDWGADDILLKYVSSANIACGFHAGDPHTMRKAVAGCLKYGVAIGAHPGLPDRLGFGRREMSITPEEAGDFVLYQTGALQAYVKAMGSRLQHVKLHGALYHMAAKDTQLAEAIVNAIHRLDPELLLYGLSGSEAQAAADKFGIRFIAEGFADRAYLPDGSLVPRHARGAVLESSADIVRQAYTLAVSGQFRTLCLHGDTLKASEHAREIVDYFQKNGITVQKTN